MITGLDTYWLLSDRSSANPDWSLLPSTMSAKLILLVCVTSGYLDISGVLKGPVGPNTPPGPYICSLLSRGDRLLLERELGLEPGPGLLRACSLLGGEPTGAG